MEIEVLRSPGDVPGDDVIDPLLATEAAGVARGTAELDGAHPAKTVSQSISHRDNTRSGHIVAVADDFQGQNYQGVVTGVQYSAAIDAQGNASRSLQIDLRVPRA